MGVETSPIVQASIAEWQKRLLQLDRRNNLLYFKPGSRSAVRVLVDDVDSFLNDLADSKGGLKFEYAEHKAKRRADPFDPITSDDDEPYVVPGDIRTDHTPLELQPRLRNLRRKDREWREEQGVNVLFLAVGFVSWIDEDSVEGKAPLLLIPCELEQASPRDPFALVREADEVVVNVTLAYKLSTLGIQLPEFDEEHEPSTYIGEVERLVRSKPGWAVTSDVVLSTFQYSKMAMWNDLERLREEGVEQELVRALAGDDSLAESPEAPSAAAVWNQPIDNFAGGGLDDALDVRDQLLVLRADYSQLLAVTSPLPAPAVPCDVAVAAAAGEPDAGVILKWVTGVGSLSAAALHPTPSTSVNPMTIVPAINCFVFIAAPPPHGFASGAFINRVSARARSRPLSHR